MVVLIPKGGDKDFRGIGIVEVLWKATTGIINQQLIAEITYHDSLNGFRTVHGTGNVILKDKLLHQLIAMR